MLGDILAANQVEREQAPLRGRARRWFCRFGWGALVVMLLPLLVLYLFGLAVGGQAAFLAAMMLSIAAGLGMFWAVQWIIAGVLLSRKFDVDEPDWTGRHYAVAVALVPLLSVGALFLLVLALVFGLSIGLIPFGERDFAWQQWDFWSRLFTLTGFNLGITTILMYPAIRFYRFWYHI